MGSCDAAVCCDSRSDSICLHPGQIPTLQMAKAPSPTITKPSTQGFTVCAVQLFHQLFDAHRASYLTERFETDLSVQGTLFHYSIVQFLYTLADWSLLTLFHFLNSSSLTVILPNGPVSLSLLFTVDVDTFLSWHWFSCAVMFGAVNLQSCKLVTNEIVF